MEKEIVKFETEATPAVLLQLAIQKDLDIEKLKQLMELQERWQAQQARKEFLSAVSKFQAECPALEKTKLVAFGTTKYKYAPLGEIAASIKDSMSKNGLSHRWEIDDSTDKINCTCIISHINGHSEKTSMSALKDASGGKNEIQQRGSSITYLQRYTLIAALGISTADEDNDGQAAPDKPVQQAPIRNDQPAQPVKPWLNPGTKEWDNSFSKIHAGAINMDDVEKYYRISHVNKQNLLNPKYVYVKSQNTPSTKP